MAAAAAPAACSTSARSGPGPASATATPSFGRGCFLARKLVEAGVPFVEVGQDNYDSHADNFVCHKANMGVLDPAWSALLDDLQRARPARGHAGRLDGRGRPHAADQQPRRPRPLHPRLDDRAGRRRHPGGQVYGATDADGRDVRDNPVTEGDLFATIYTALGINPRVRHFVGTRPIWATPENARVVREVLA